MVSQVLRSDHRSPTAHSAWDRQRLVWVAVAQVVAFWPVWGWYCRRVADPSDGQSCLVPLALAAGWLGWQFYRRPARCASSSMPTGFMWSAGFLVLLYAVLYHALPPLLRAGLALTVLCVTASVLLGGHFHLPLWGLLMVSLPLVPTLQFFAGFPLRRLCTELSARLLMFTGFQVSARGTCLAFDGQLVAVDAPCSGVSMLWTAGVLTFALACYRGFNARQTLVLGVAGILSVIAGNVVRSSSLFFLEAKLLPLDPWFHDGVGMVVFGGVCGFLMVVAWWCRDRFQASGTAKPI